MQESRPVCTHGNSLILLRLFASFLHHDISVASRDLHQILVWHLGRYAEAVDQTLLLFNFLLLDSEFVLHLFEILSQKLVLLSELLTGDGKLFVFFLSIDEVESDSS